MKTLAAAVLLCLCRLASAGDRTITLDRTCVEIDGAVDSLAPPDREYAEKLLRQVLERENQLVVTSECTETYRLSHERVEDHYVIRLHNPAGKRRMKVPSLDELYVKYDKMVRSLLAAKAAVRELAATRESAAAGESAAAPEPQAAAAPQVATAEPVDVTDSMHNEPIAIEQPAEEQAPAKPSMWYGLFGFQLTGGPTLAGGYRHGLRSVVLDFAAAARGADLHGFTFGVKVLADTQSSESSSLYGGGGLSVGTFARGGEVSDRSYYSGGGLHAELTGGIRFPAGRHQGMIQFDVTLPLYGLSNDAGETDYAATASLTGGIGW